MTKKEKESAVEELKDAISRYRTVGLIDMVKMPTKQLQLIKKGLGDRAVVKISKKTLVKFALKNLGRKDLEGKIPKQPGLVLTNLESFQFYKIVSGLRYPTYAKEGDSIEKEIHVKAGPTNLLPGPVISELAKVGLIAGVEGGKVAIKKDAVIAKKGSKASKELAGVLRKLKIEPIEIGINIDILYEDGKMYSKDILNLVETYPSRLVEAFGQALNLSIAIGYPTKENVKYLFAKAYQQAKALEKIGGV